MTTSTHIHYPTSVEAADFGTFGALKFRDEHHNAVTVFMPFAVAEAMRMAFEAMQEIDEPDEPNEAEPRGIDDSGYRRDMIDAGRGHLLGE